MALFGSAIFMRKSEKQELVKKLSEALSAAKGVIVVDYQGLATRDMETLRAGLREVGAKLMVVKNTLLKLALQKTEKLEELQGQSALIIANEDEIAPLQVIAKMAKEKEKPSFKFGFLEKKFMEGVTLSRLALLPTKNVLYGQLIGTIAGPMYGLIYSLQANLQSLIYTLSEYKSKR